MKNVDLVTLVLVIVGALNWGLVGAFQFNLVTAIFGVGAISNIVFILVGVAGVYQLVRLFAAPRQLSYAAAAR